MTIVECINQVPLSEALFNGALTVAIKGEYYTVRGVVDNEFFVFEEIYFGKREDGVEIGQRNTHFREIQFQADLQEQIEEW